MNPCLQVLERAVRERQVAELLPFGAGDRGPREPRAARGPTSGCMMPNVMFDGS